MLLIYLAQVMDQSTFFIIVTNNNVAELKRLIPAILAVLSVNQKIVIVDNGSTDGTQELSKQFSSVYFIENKANMGLVKALNIGIKFALSNRTSGIVLLSPHINPDSVTNLSVPSLTDTVVSPTLCYYANGKLQYSVGGYVSKLLHPQLFWLPTKPPKSYNKRPEYLSLHCLYIPKKIIEKVGLFNEAFRHWFAEVEYCERVRRAGFKLKVDPLTEVQVLPYHLSKQALQNSRKDYRVLLSQLMRGKKQLVKGIASIALFVPGLGLQYTRELL